MYHVHGDDLVPGGVDHGDGVVRLEALGPLGVEGRHQALRKGHHVAALLGSYARACMYRWDGVGGWIT